MSHHRTPARRFRATFWPTLITVPALFLQLGLGVWQLDRLAWKSTLLAERAAALAAPPIVEPTDLDPRQDAFRRVTVTGVFRHDKEMHLAARSQNGNFGYQVITPLRRPGGGHVLVNRGWVPAKRKDPATRAAGQLAGAVTITGIVRGAGTGSAFIPDNDPAANVWFTVDPAAMAAHAGLADAALWMVEAGAAANPGGLPIGGQTRTDIPNDHLQYAFTWFALAAALLVIYVLYHYRREDEDE